jgi:mycothiol synthase
MTPSLPEGYTDRPAVEADAPACVDIANANLVRDIGHATWTSESLLSDWNAPNFDLGTAGRAVLDPKGEVVAFATVRDNFNPPLKVRLRGHVHPEHMGRGIGAWILAWSEARSREAIARCPDGARVSVMSYCYAEASTRRALLSHGGFEVVRSSFLMGFDLSTPTDPPTKIEGIQFRPYRHDADLETMVRNDLEAFRDHWGFIENPFEEELEHFRHFIETMEGGFDPSLCTVAFDGDEMVGHCLVVPQQEGDPTLAYLDTMAVRRPWRRRGIARAMLLMTFEALRRRGNAAVCLHVDADSLMGATGLYTSVGMTIDRRSLSFEKVLREGRDMSTVDLADG